MPEPKYVVRILGHGAAFFSTLVEKDDFVEEAKRDSRVDVIVEDVYHSDLENGYGRPLSDSLI